MRPQWTPSSSVDPAFLGLNPVQHLLGPTGLLSTLPAANQRILTGREFFPRLIAGPFHNGLIVVFRAATNLAVLGALASLLRGGRPGPTTGQQEEADRSWLPSDAPDTVSRQHATK